MLAIKVDERPGSRLGTDVVMSDAHNMDFETPRYVRDPPNVMS
jgi:hypothetical protein